MGLENRSRSGKSRSPVHTRAGDPYRNSRGAIAKDISVRSLTRLRSLNVTVRLWGAGHHIFILRVKHSFTRRITTSIPLSLGAGRRTFRLRDGRRDIGAKHTFLGL